MKNKARSMGPLGIAFLLVASVIEIGFAVGVWFMFQQSFVSILGADGSNLLAIGIASFIGLCGILVFVFEHEVKRRVEQFEAAYDLGEWIGSTTSFDILKGFIVCMDLIALVDRVWFANSGAIGAKILLTAFGVLVAFIPPLLGPIVYKCTHQPLQHLREDVHYEMEAAEILSEREQHLEMDRQRRRELKAGRYQRPLAQERQIEPVSLHQNGHH